MRRLLCSAALILSATTVSAQSLDDVLATVDGTEITLGELLIARTQLPAQYQQLPPEQLFDGLLSQVIQQQLIASKVEEVPLRLELAIRNETRGLKAGEALLAITDAALTEDAINAAYKANFLDKEKGEEYHARHILLEDEDAAKALLTEIQGGADFAEMAKEHSTGPSGPAGGDLGWFGAGVMVPAFEEAVVAMEAGDVSEPVQTQFGWHLIKLEEVRAQEAPALEEVLPQIQDQLRAEAVNAYVAELEADAEIVKTEGVDPAVVGMGELLETK